MVRTAWACLFVMAACVVHAETYSPLTETEWGELMRSYPAVASIIENIREQEALLHPEEEPAEIHCTTGWQTSQSGRPEAAAIQSLSADVLRNNPPIRSAHFVVSYVDQEGKPVVDRAIAQAASDDFERAYQTYRTAYGIDIVPDKDDAVCNVYFLEKITNHTTFQDHGNVFLDAGLFGTSYAQNALTRKLMVYHQAFHLLERAAKIPVDSRMNLWFNEGSAIWAEMAYGHIGGTEKPSITGAWKLQQMWNLTPPVPLTSEFNREYALPIIVFMETYYPMDGGFIESVIKQFKDVPAKNDKYAIPKLIEKVSGKPFDELILTFASRVVLKWWNLSPDGAKTVEIWDATVPSETPIAVPDLNLAEYDIAPRVSQGETLKSESTYGESSFLVHKATFELKEFNPEKTWSARVTMDALTSTQGQAVHYAVFPAGATSMPTVETSVPKNFDTSTNNAATPITDYIVTASDYGDGLKYTITGQFVAP